MTHGNVFWLSLRPVCWLAVGMACLAWRASFAADGPDFGASFDQKSDIAYPASHAVVDVTKAPYFAKGDGQTDDTDALQRALSDVMGQHKLLYLPAGTYLVSKTINWSKKNSAGR